MHETPLPHPVRAIILDLDGTLLDTEANYRAAFFSALAEVGWTMDERQYDRLVGLPSPTRRTLLPRMLGDAFPVDRFIALYYRHRDTRLASGVPLKPGASALLDWLDGERLPCAIATSASRRTALSHLAKSGLCDRIGTIITRDDVRRGKPAPDSFVRAAGDLGIPPSCCVAVEDSAHGIAAAHAAGTMPIMVPDHLAPSCDVVRRCVAVLPNLHDVTAILERCAGGRRAMKPAAPQDRSRLRAQSSA